MVCLGVSDTGRGILPAHRERIFDPVSLDDACALPPQSPKPRNRRAPIHWWTMTRNPLILRDAVMPGLSGGKAFDEIKLIQPGARAIPRSGYGNEVDREAVERHDFQSFLKKLSSVREFPETMKRALARP